MPPRIRNHKGFIEQRLEHGDGCARNNAMRGRIRRMRRASSRIGHRQKISSMGVEACLQRSRVQNIRVDRILGRSSNVVVNPPGESFGADPQGCTSHFW